VASKLERRSRCTERRGYPTYIEAIEVEFVGRRSVDDLRGIIDVDGRIALYDR
jgi:hypothetical protein